MRLLPCLVLIVAPFGPSATAQTVPSDLDVVASAGGAFPDGPASTIVTVQISADGTGAYSQYHSGLDASAGAGPVAFSLTSGELEQLWQAIESNGFFGLQDEYTEAAVRDGTFARLTVTANGSTHSVITRNLAVEPFDAIVATINGLTPKDADLIYDTDGPFSFEPVPICEQPDRAGRRATPALDLWPASEPRAAAKLASAASVPRVETAAHPGTVVAYRIPLAEAVGQGIAMLTAKGETFGDAVKIEVDNSGSLTTDDLRITLYLELWGFGASDAVAAEVESAIEDAWSGTTSGGMAITTDVVLRVSPITISPGTPGFHQIQMIPDSTFKPDVFEQGEPYGVNEGTAGGKWPSVGSSRKAYYAHEAGHLLGFDDRYNEYFKQQNGMWKRQSDGETFSDQQLADEIAAVRPDLSLEEILNRIQAPGQDRITAPKPGFTDDIMGSIDGDVQQSDLDALAALAGLVVEVRPGDTFVNKSGGRQSMTVTRTEDVFVLAGGMTTLEGLYAACIDRASGIPDPSDGFDLAPPVSAWEGIEAAPHVMALLEYINEEEQFCPADFGLSVLWRLTNNAGRSDPDIADYLAEAGIDIGFRDLDFPRLSSPNALSPSSAVLVPTQLFVPNVVLTDGVVVGVDAPVSLTADLQTPLPDDEEAALMPAYRWSLDAPEGSAATLGGTESETTSFMPDVRGFYEVSLRVDLPASATGAPGTGDDTFTQETTQLMVASDSLVETFESGALAESRYFWTTSGTSGEPWFVTDELAHTGSYSVRSAPIGDGALTTLQATFDQTTDGVLSFRYWLGSHFSDSLLVAVDGAVLLRLSSSNGWRSAEVVLPAGSHTVTWTYAKDASESLGADRAWLDDVFFPETAVGTDVEDSEEPHEPLTVSLAAPNPASATSSVWLYLPRPGPVRAALYDPLGREVVVVLDEVLPAGRHRLTLPIDRLASGLYVLRATSADGSASRRLTVVR